MTGVTLTPNQEKGIGRQARAKGVDTDVKVEQQLKRDLDTIEKWVQKIDGGKVEASNNRGATTQNPAINTSPTIAHTLAVMVSAKGFQELDKRVQGRIVQEFRSFAERQAKSIDSSSADYETHISNTEATNAIKVSVTSEAFRKLSPDAQLGEIGKLAKELDKKYPRF